MFPVARSMTNYFVILTMVWLGTIYECVTHALVYGNMVDLLGLADLEFTGVEAGLFLETYGASVEGVLEFVQRRVHLLWKIFVEGRVWWLHDFQNLNITFLISNVSDNTHTTGQYQGTWLEDSLIPEFTPVWIRADEGASFYEED